MKTMILTTTEKNLLEELRRREIGMYRFRCWFLAIGVFSYIVAAYIAFQMQYLNRLGESPALAALFFSYALPCFYFIAVLGSVFIGTAIRDWRGNAIRILLIKLIDENTKE
jgi:hypothetical protein